MLISAISDSPRAPGLATIASFVLRVTALIALLATPILGTTYALVSSVSADIRMARVEHAELGAFARVIDLVPPLEALQRDLERGKRAAVAHDRVILAAADRQAEAVYAAHDRLPASQAVWQHWHRLWHNVDQRTTSAGISAALAALEDISGELDDDSPLDVDPNFAVQNLASSVLRQSPRGVVAARHTADAIRVAQGPVLDVRSIERIATARALQIQPLQRALADIPFAISLEPQIGPALRAPADRALQATQRFSRDVDRILATLRADPAARLRARRSAEQTIDAHIALWRESLRAADRLIVVRLNAQLRRRRVIIAFALLAVVLGTIALTVAIRHMARRDRLALAAVKLESDKLRAELQQVSVERALRLQEAQFRSVFENADLGIVIFNLDGTIAQSNAAVSAMLGQRRHAMLVKQQHRIGGFAESQASLVVEELLIRADGSAQWLACTFSGVYDDGRCQLVILLLRDMTEEKLLHQRLVFAARHDGLTQIANRAAFEEELQAVVAERNDRVALLYIDLDSFKPVNDTFGHAAGDHVLVATAERLRSALAGTDFCARLGGDEFAAIVRGTDDQAVLASIGARVCASVAAPVDFAGSTFAVTASIGIALLRRDDSAAEWKFAADSALYAVKGRGGNGYQLAADACAVSVLTA